MATSITGCSEVVTPIREHLGVSPWPSRKPEQCPVPKDSLVWVGTLLAWLPVDLVLPPSGAREPAHPGSQAELLYALQAITQYMVS